MKAVYPGSFDPITLGHIDVIKRASLIFEELTIAVMHNPRKTTTFSVDERIIMIKDAIKDLKNVEVTTDVGLTVDLAKRVGAKVLIRGIRAVMDYESELQTATANQLLAPEIETVFLVSRPEYSFISSSTIKEIAFNHGDISRVVTPLVEKEIKKHYGY